VTTNIRAQFIRWVSDDFPGLVECRFTDRLGQQWLVIEKVPVLTDGDLRSDSQLPQPAFIPCEIVARGQDNAGREIADVTTIAAIEATDGTTCFQLYVEQLQVSDD
jgi:hypothetical protein